MPEQFECKTKALFHIFITVLIYFIYRQQRATICQQNLLGRLWCFKTCTTNAGYISEKLSIKFGTASQQILLGGSWSAQNHK